MSRRTGPHILVFDVGTSAVKTALFDAALRPAAVAVREYPLQTRGVCVEARPDDYLLAMRSGAAAMPEADIAAIGMTTQGETLVPVDARGAALTDAIVWLDARAQDEARLLRGGIEAQAFYETTGLPEITPALPLAKLLHLRERMPDVWRRAAHLLLLEDYLLFRLTGQMVTEPSLQTSTGWFRLDTDGYWAEGLSAAEIPADKLPELRECGSLAGPLLGEAARQLGLKAGTPVFTGAMDQTAAALAAGSGNGVVTETTGTALVAAAVTQTLRFPAGHPVTLYRHAVKGQFVYLPIGNTAGMALRWFRDQFCPDLPAGGAGYAALDRMAAAVPPGCEGLVFLPYLSGCVDPDSCPQARAVFFGATLAHTRAHFARAVLESTAFALADFLEMLAALGCPCRELRSLGGGAASGLWQQIKADACGRTLTVPACREATAQGAAILAGRGCGLMAPDFLPAVPPAARYIPDPSVAGAYARAREQAHQLYTAVRPLY